MCEFFRPLYKIINSILGTYLTSNWSYTLCFLIDILTNCFKKFLFQVLVIQLPMNILCEYEKLSGCCRKNSKSDDNFMIKMTGKWWKIFASIGGTIASFSQLPWLVLDPQMKLQALQFYYSKLDNFTCNEKVGNIRVKMDKLFEEYVNVIGCIKFPNCSSSWTRFQSRDGRHGSMHCKLIICICYQSFVFVSLYLI